MNAGMRPECVPSPIMLASVLHWAFSSPFRTQSVKPTLLHNHLKYRSTEIEEGVPPEIGGLSSGYPIPSMWVGPMREVLVEISVVVGANQAQDWSTFFRQQRDIVCKREVSAEFVYDHDLNPFHISSCDKTGVKNSMFTVLGPVLVCGRAVEY